jgi:glycosyltransferase involved in cell wall biosynthesis
MKFSIGIPNYNYGRYVGKAIQSFLDQSYPNFELLIADNASTDDSVAVVRSFTDPRVRLSVNACNVGFAGNIDRSIRMGDGDRVLLFPSDDLMWPGALELFHQFLVHLGAEADTAILCATGDVIDTEDRITSTTGPDKTLFFASDRAADLERVFGIPVYRVSSDELLRRCLTTLRNPFNLTTTSYARTLYDQVEGFGGNKVINPDKWFHWKLMGVAKTVYYVDKPLCGMRWHPMNQTYQQTNSGALKFLVDDYVSTFELDAGLLERLGFSRTDIERAYVEYDIARHGLATLALGDVKKARRIATFGRATYPQHAWKNEKLWALRALLWAGPFGKAAAKVAYAAWNQRTQG